MPGSVIESFRKFWSSVFSIALVLCWFHNYPSSQSPDHSDNGPFQCHLRELARVIDAVRCHDDMFSAMQPLDGRLWTIGTHGPTAGSAWFCTKVVCFYRLLGTYLKVKLLWFNFYSRVVIPPPVSLSLFVFYMLDFWNVPDQRKMSEAVGREFKRKAKREAKRLAQIHTRVSKQYCVARM